VEQVFALADAGLSQREIGERLGIPKGTIGARIYRRKKAQA
jgi:DNA-directed RNA polymerase specialized sigma24 family protein